jgi:type II secretory pathway component PulF
MAYAPRALANIYQQWATQLSAGLTLVQTLRIGGGLPRGEGNRLADLAEGGQPIPRLFDAASEWLPRHDRPLLIAGAHSGRLPRILVHLAHRYEQLHRTRSKLLQASLYPILVYHFAALVFPLVLNIDFQKGLDLTISGYCLQVLLWLTPLWGTALWLNWLVKRESPLADVIFSLLPVVASYRRHQRLADFSFALGQMLEAGASIDAAWHEAANTARSRPIRRAADQVLQVIAARQAPGPKLGEHPVFPEDFRTRYLTGELTGSLEHALAGLATDYQARAETRLNVVAIVYPLAVFGAVGLLVALVVIRFFMGYYGMIADLADGKF